MMSIDLFNVKRLKNRIFFQYDNSLLLLMLKDNRYYLKRQTTKLSSNMLKINPRGDIMTENATDQAIEKAKSKGAAKMAQIVYILYLIGIVVGLTGLIGLIMAYVNKGDAPDWLKSHYQFQIRTFWIGLLFAIIGGATSAFGVGFLIIFATFVWFVVRCVKGLKVLSKEQAVPNPTTWIW